MLEVPPGGFDGHTNGLVGHGLLEGSLVLRHVLVPVDAHDLCVFLQKNLEEMTIEFHHEQRNIVWFEYF